MHSCAQLQIILQPLQNSSQSKSNDHIINKRNITSVLPTYTASFDLMVVTISSQFVQYLQTNSSINRAITISHT